MLDWLSRTELMFGGEGIEKLKNSRVAVFGIGGVGGYAVEALVRAGIGAIDLIDGDKVNVTNLNRQLIATRKTIGMYKVDAAAERIAEINPDCSVIARKIFFLPENEDSVDFSLYDYVVDAIDTVAGKIAIIGKSKLAGTPVISSMGAGNKTDPTKFEVCDVFKTSVCPLAKIMRRELKKINVDSLKVVFSPELPIKTVDCGEKNSNNRPVPASNSFVPPVAGLVMAGEVIKDLIGFGAVK